MDSGDLILISFPFTIPNQSKIRPAVIITKTLDKYSDIIVCAISSVVPKKLSEREILIGRNAKYFKKTGLRVDSVIKIDRIATLRETDVVAVIGKCSAELWETISNKFKDLAGKK